MWQQTTCLNVCLSTMDFEIGSNYSYTQTWIEKIQMWFDTTIALLEACNSDGPLALD